MDFDVCNDGMASSVKSLTLINSYSVFNCPISVCYHNKNTYAGLETDGMIEIDDSYITSSLTTLPEACEGITTYKDKIYTLLRGEECPQQVEVFDLLGRLICQWNHLEKECYNQLAVVADQVVIPDRPNKRLCVYSLFGECIKEISLPQMVNNRHICLCAADGNSVVISEFSSQIYKVNIATGNVVWTCREAIRPMGVTCYDQKYILAASENTNTLHILDVKTGKFATIHPNVYICQSCDIRIFFRAQIN